jgi:hypothetical protein
MPSRVGGSPWAFLPGKPLTTGLQHEAGIDHAQHRPPLALAPGDHLQAAGADRDAAVVLEDEILLVELLLVGRRVRLTKNQSHSL